MKGRLLAIALALMTSAGLLATGLTEEEAMDIPVAGVGTMAVYDVTSNDRPGKYTLYVEWLAPQQVFDEDGFERWAFGIAQQLESDGDRTEYVVSWFDADGQAIAERLLYDEDYEICSICRDGAGLVNEGHVNYRLHRPTEVAGICGISGPSFDGYCGMEPIVETGPGHYVAGDMAITYAPGVPMPVSAKVSLPMHGFGDHLYRLDLVSWIDGTAMVLPSDVRPPAGVVFRDARTGFIDGSIGSFTLDEAIDAAMRQPSDRDLPTWLANHPKAYLAEARTASWTNDAQAKTDDWDLVWSDGRESFQMSVTRTYYAGLSTVDVAIDAEVENMYPARNALPDHVPTMASLMGRFVHVMGDLPLPLEGFGYSAACDPCDDPSVLLWISKSDHHFSTSPMTYFVGVTPYRTDSEVVVVNQNGDLVRHTDTKYNEDQTMPRVGAEPGAGASVPPSLPSRAVAAPVAAGIGFALFAALIAAWPLWKTLPSLALFSRIRPAQVLEHPTRQLISDIIRAEPGIHFQELIRRAGISRGSVGHHVRKLEEADLIISRGRGYRCLFPKEIDRRVIMSATALKSDGARKVHDDLLTHGVSRLSVVADRTGLSPSTVSHHLARMRRAGLVAGGGHQGYEAVEAMASVL